MVLNNQQDQLSLSIEYNLPLLDSLAASIRHVKFEDKDNLGAAVEWILQVLRAFKEQEYSPLLNVNMWHNSTGHFDWHADLNTAFIYWLMKDTISSQQIFQHVKDATYGEWPGDEIGRTFSKCELSLSMHLFGNLLA